MGARKHRARLTLPGAVLATAAAGFFLSGTAATAADTEPVKVRCLGVNACQGKSECKTANALKGQNACQGRGLLFLTEEQCHERGGKVERSGSRSRPGRRRAAG